MNGAFHAWEVKNGYSLHSDYTPKAVVIDNHLPRQPLISSYVPDWPLPPHVYLPWESEMALRARIYAYNRHLSFDVAFICSTLTHCGVCHLSVWRLKWEVRYVHQSVWRWKWFFCQSNYVLQRLRPCRTSDTVFRREIDSRRQWDYGTCYSGIVSPLRRSVHSDWISTHHLWIINRKFHTSRDPRSNCWTIMDHFHARHNCVNDYDLWLIFTVCIQKLKQYKIKEALLSLVCKWVQLCSQAWP